MDIKKYIAKVPDFPKKGIVFLDVTPIFASGEAYSYCTNELAKMVVEAGATKIVSPEARGFLTGAPVAAKLSLPFIPVRKPGKLPRKQITIDYELEYGTNTLCVNEDAFNKGDKVFIIDDLLATGGTVKATCELAESKGAEVVGIGFYIILTDLPGAEVLKNYNVKTLMEFTEEI